MQFTFYATVTKDVDNVFLVTFADVPEAITFGHGVPEALREASDALGVALRGYLLDGRSLPEPASREGVAVSVNPEDALKLAVISAFIDAKISKSELARRLGKSENEARRILDPDHGTKLGQMEDALRALGKRIVISVEEAA